MFLPVRGIPALVNCRPEYYNFHMKRTVGFILLAGCVLISCSSKQESYPTREKEPASENLPRQGGPGKPEGYRPLQILQIAFVPANPVSSDDLRVVPAVTEGELGDIDYQYQWAVNNIPVTDVDGDRITHDHYRKLDWVSCRVKAVQRGTNRESAWIKSNLIGIGNSPPSIASLPVGDFSVPGVFRYRIEANDFDQDELTYELLSPLDAGIRLDSRTGRLEWGIDEALIQRLGEAIEIRFQVVDSDGGKVGGSLKLNLRSQEQTTEKR
jgi:hypothetical protein